MTTIQQLNTVSTLTSNDYLPIFVSRNGDTYKITAEVLRTFVTENIATPSTTEEETVYYAPTTVATISFPTGSDVWMIITPADPYISKLTLVLPDALLTAHGTIIRIYCTTTIVNISYSLNNATAIVGSSTEMFANTPFAFKFDLITRNWYRI